MAAATVLRKCDLNGIETWQMYAARRTRIPRSQRPPLKFEFMHPTELPSAPSPNPSVRQIAKQVLKPVGRNVRDAMLFCGLWPKLKDVDRIVLDEKIFPYLLQRNEYQNILFVGCHWYTWQYNKVFANKNYSTLEIEPQRARYGAKRHVIGSVEDVADHYPPGSLDLVLFLGVIGWGLEDPEVANHAIHGFHRILRPGGALIIGWDDVPEHKPFALSELDGLEKFSSWTFPPLGSDEHVCDHDLRHTFNFYLADKSSSTDA